MTDFLTELRRDLVEAATREQQRKPMGRALRSWWSWTWRPALIVGGLAAAAAIVAAFLSVLLLAPNPTPAEHLHVVATVRVGGIPLSAAFGNGSLWVTDFRGAVVRIDPKRDRVLARIPTSGAPGAIVVVPGAVWTRTVTQEQRTRLVRIDPTSGRVVLQRPLAFGDGLAIGAGAVWTAQPGTASARGALLAFDPRTGDVTASLSIANADGVAVGGDTVWTVGTDGTVTEIDARSHRVVRSFPRLASGNAGASGADVLIADASGAWVLSGARSILFRVAHGHVTRRIAVARDTQPVLARDGDALWTATGDQYARHHMLRRLDARSGRVTTSVDLGAHRPVAIVPTRAAIYAVNADGTVAVVRQAP